MSAKSSIEWTEATWNPTVGCTHVSPGCDNCYAARLASGRLKHLPTYAGLADGGKFNGTVRLIADRLDQPLRWKTPRMVFVNSMSDLFHDDVPDSFIAEVFGRMAAVQRHTFQVLTKRHGRMRSLLNRPDFRDEVYEHAWAYDQQGIYDPFGQDPGWWPLPNVWLGVSVENQRWADIRIPALLDTPAAVRFLSCEPLLGPVDVGRWVGCGDPAHRHTGSCALFGADHRIGWVITGGESGQGARMASNDWFRTIRDQCTAAGVAYFHKQNGNKKYGRELDGRTWDEFPTAVTQ